MSMSVCIELRLYAS